jgi:hypothetical protein
MSSVKKIEPQSYPPVSKQIKEMEEKPLKLFERTFSKL